MRRPARFFGLVAFLLLTLSLVFLPLTEAKRKSKRASVANNGNSLPAKPLTQPLRAQASSLVPVSSQAAAFAISPAVRDLPAEPITKRDGDLDPPLKMNPNKIIRAEVADPEGPLGDHAIQSSAPQPNIPATSTNFEGMSIFDTIALGQGFLPPDTEGDVGPNHYVQVVNSTWRVWNKVGVPQTPVMTLGSIFNSLPVGNLCRGNDGDPIVLYDSYADRWLITQFTIPANPNNHQCIAVSRTPDPTGQYFIYDFVMPNNKFNDYPKFGVWPDGYYMTNNQFNQAGTAFLGGGAFAYDRAKMLAGDPTATYIYFDLFNLDPSIGGMLPSDADGLNPPPAGAPNVFSYFIATEFGDASDGLRLFDFHADFAVPGNSTFTERAESPIAVAAFDPSTPAGRDDIEQPPPANNATAALDAIGDRLMNRLQYRNFGTHESLIVNHTVNVGTGTTQALHQAGVRYYELRRSGGAYGVNEQATFSPDTTNRWMGSAAMDHQGNLAVGYSVSSTTVFPGIRYAGRLAGDPPNGLFQGEATLQPGGFVQTNTSSRWGDYSNMTVDPIDDCTFWYTNEYYLDDQPGITAEWHTRIGAFKVNPACVAPQQGTLQVNVTNCESGLPLQGAVSTVNGNVYGATAASGQYTTQLSPGSYSVAISATNFVPATPVNVNITNGNTSVVNVCLVGMPIIDTDGSTLTAESCDPADGAVSPGETVTFDFALKNVGTMSTNNLVATLQATGGVTNPSGPQSYGLLTQGGPSVSRAFTFTADNAFACGNSITATFDLTDGMTNLGTVTFTIKLGVLGFGVTTSTESTGNIAVPIPDVSSVDIPINVTGTPRSVSDVNVRVRLNHTFDGDLEIRLIAPDGTTVLLSDNRGGAGDNFGTGANDCSGTHTVFDDSAATAISAGVAPFAGSFRPEQPLSALNGKDAVGTWTLRVTDTAALDVGTVGCVQLELATREYLCCPFTAGTPDILAQPPAILLTECGTNGAADPGEVVTMSFPMANGGSAPTTNLVATLQASGGVIPLSGPQTYGALSPFGEQVARDFTFAVDSMAACGSNLTATFALQDGMTNLGTVDFTIRVGGTMTNVVTFSNPAAITILDTPRVGGIAPSSPYPSTTNVAGVAGTVTKVTAKITGLSHTFPGDIDMLLVGPGGQRLMLMSDVGGGTDAVNATLTFDDSAATPIGATVISGTFRPTNIGTGDVFPAPAPAGPFPDPQLLSVFNGLNPNGTWSLFVVDDAGVDAGSISMGWELTITTEDPLCETTQAPVKITNVSVDKPSLWPPNHKMQDVMVNYDVTSCSTCSLSVSSNEPENGTGDGDTSPDWEIVDPHHVKLRAERAGTGNDRIYTITITCQNGVNTDVETVEVRVAHNIKGPATGASFKINTPVTFTGTFWDRPGRTHTALWSFDSLTTSGTVTEPSGSGNGQVRGAYSFSTPGVYKVRMTVKDNTGAASWVETQNDLEAIVVIYDPNGGYTIGGGWLQTPFGAYLADPSLSGKLSFGFTSKYFKNATNPKGETHLSFAVGDMTFNAVNFDYLTISNGRAQFKGLGKINGEGAYHFILTVIDGDLIGAVDLFRIKIWNKTTGAVVFDTQPGASDADNPTTPVGTGSSIVIKN